MPEKKPAGHKRGQCRGERKAEVPWVGTGLAQQHGPVRAHDVVKRIRNQDEPRPPGVKIGGDHDRGHPKPEGQKHADKLGGVAQEYVQAGNDPAEPHREQPDNQKIDGHQQKKNADALEIYAGCGHHQDQGEQVADKGREKHRDRDDLGGKDRLGDEVRLIEQARRRPLHGIAEKQPRQHACEQK